ncbi:MAG: hypothetical protein P0Y55_11925 [Candidatus Cohnella colombiensis]|uniref:Uncharacterized protein n=1 Tax=Candidatus Cohnella colombiensis TaxID=3121368 RepID=A0AA95ETU5_9BACL|nr:MAG: hypothetical protein P0Y55_11925 [Cohnella sp.]
MDRKTLEYMEGRAAKAREIVDRIEELLRDIERVKRSGNIEIYTPTRSVYINDYHHKGVLPSSSRTYLFALMINLFIDVTLQEIQQLESELAEL